MPAKRIHGARMINLPNPFGGDGEKKEGGFELPKVELPKVELPKFEGFPGVRANLRITSHAL